MGLKIICILILGIFACNKVNQWKQPTKVCFNIDIEDEVAADGKLVFNTGYLNIQSFQFEGKRKEGADVYFSKVYTDGLYASLKTKGIEDLSFDIPQGMYSSIEVKVISKKDQLPNLVINGTFEAKNGINLPVCFEFDESELFEMEGKDLTGTAVNLIEDSKTNATILLKPAKWFKEITTIALQSAEQVIVGGENTILINKNTNQQLYYGVVNALEKEKQNVIFVRQ